MFRFYLRQLVKTFFRPSRRCNRPAAARRVHSYRPRIEDLEDRTVLNYNVSLDAVGGLNILTVSQANPGDTSDLTVSLAGGLYTFSDPGIKFNAASGSGAGDVTNNGTSITVKNDAVDRIVVDLGDGTDAIALGDFDDQVDPLAVTGGGDAADTATVTKGGSGITAAGDVTLTGFDTITDSNQITTTAGSGGTVRLTADATASSSLTIDGTITSDGPVSLTGAQ